MVEMQETPQTAAKMPDSGGYAAPMERAAELAAHTPYQLFSLARLRQLLELQQREETARLEPWKQNALAKVVYSVFLDCVAAGVEQEARKFLEESAPKQARTPSASA